MLVDYFRVRFPTTDALAIIRDVLKLNPDYMLFEDYGKYGYENKYVIDDINIMYSIQSHLGVLLELKGKGYDGTEIEDTKIKNRFEIHMKNERAYYAVVDLLTYRDAERTAFSIINHYVCFVDREEENRKVNGKSMRIEQAELKDKHKHLLQLEKSSIEERIDTAIPKGNGDIF